MRSSRSSRPLMIGSGAFPFGVEPFAALVCLAGQHGPAGDRGPDAGQQYRTVTSY